MKWIPVEKARQLKFNEPVFIKDQKSGWFGAGILRKKEDDGTGLKWTFESAEFTDNWNIDGRPETTTTITHVAIP